MLVLCYHGVRSEGWRADEPAFPDLHVPAETFDAQCRVLGSMCHPISLAEWRSASARGRSLPERSVLITFDDGYRSVYETALPILKRHRLPAVLFACSEPIAGGRLFWYDGLARERGMGAVAEYLECARERQRFEVPAAPVADPRDPLAPLTVDQLKALADAGVEVGVHTATHANLALLGVERQREELAVCRDTLTKWLGARATVLSYPWGQPQRDYTDETIAVARTLGFETAFTTRAGFVTSDHSDLERPRFLAMWDLGPAELAHRIAYAWR